VKRIPQWLEAQKEEKGLWDGLIHHDYHILHTISHNALKAHGVMNSLGRRPEKSLEVGIGPFGLGISAFLPEIPFRLALDPLPPVSLDSSPDSELHSTYELRAYMQRLRAPIHYMQGCGEELPVRTGTMDLVICCNALDHVSDPDAVLQEMHRVLKSDGYLYFDVDTFLYAASSSGTCGPNTPIKTKFSLPRTPGECSKTGW